MDLVAEGTLVGVDAHVWDREAQLVGHSVSTYSAPIFVCAKGELRVDLEARERGGELSAYITPLFGVPDALLHLPLAASRLLMSAEALGLPGFTKHGKVEEATLLAEKIVRRTLNVEASSCAVVLAAKDSSGGGLQLRLFDEEKGIELDDSQGLETAKATACATDDGPLALLMELRILRGSAEVLWTMQPLSD
jgi:hypothetical protein